MYTTYILYSESLDRYYIGYTSNEVEVRLGKHLAKHKGFTRKADDWILKYFENYQTKKEAMLREKTIKS
jgi:putative endonuclease